MSRKGQMKIAPDGVRGKLRWIGSIKSPIGTTEKIAALSYFHSSFQDFVLYGLPFIKCNVPLPLIPSHAVFCAIKRDFQGRGKFLSLRRHFYK
jgi:hypothetical protein